jgi:hypothetical protein
MRYTLPIVLLCSIFHYTLSYAQGFALKNKYSTLEAGFSTAYFTGRDLPFRANKAASPGATFALMTRQGGRVSNGFRFTMNFPGSKSIGRPDTISEYTFFHYQTRIHKYDFFLITDLIQHRSRYQKRPDFVPYLYTGIGWIKFRQFARYGYEEKKRVSSITGTTYAKRSLVLPLGLGLRFKLAKMWDLSLEVIYNYTFTNQLDMDYIHSFSTMKRNDSYLNVNLKLGYL